MPYISISYVALGKSFTGIDRLVIKEGVLKRLTDSLETALKLADGLVVVDCEGKEELFSSKIFYRYVKRKSVSFG